MSQSLKQKVDIYPYEDMRSLAQFRATHTFKRSCKRCHGNGDNGKYITGPEKGLYIPCRCAKKKPKVIKKGAP